MRPPPLRLSSWPSVVVRIDCRLCPRKGSYRLARLAVRFGPDMEMDRLLAHLASDCPWWRARPSQDDQSCGARFVDLDRAAQPDLPAGVETDVLRQRPPARENVPQRRTTTPSATWAMPMLSGVQSATLILSCRRCGRRDAYVVAALLAAGGDRRLTDVSRELRASCPKRDAPALHERCDVVLEAGG